MTSFPSDRTSAPQTVGQLVRMSRATARSQPRISSDHYESSSRLAREPPRPSQSYLPLLSGPQKPASPSWRVVSASQVRRSHFQLPAQGRPAPRPPTDRAREDGAGFDIRPSPDGDRISAGTGATAGNRGNSVPRINSRDRKGIRTEGRPPAVPQPLEPPQVPPLPPPTKVHKTHYRPFAPPRGGRAISSSDLVRGRPKPLEPSCQLRRSSAGGHRDRTSSRAAPRQAPAPPVSRPDDSLLHVQPHVIPADVDALMEWRGSASRGETGPLMSCKRHRAGLVRPDSAHHGDDADRHDGGSRRVRLLQERPPWETGLIPPTHASHDTPNLPPRAGSPTHSNLPSLFVEASGIPAGIRNILGANLDAALFRACRPSALLSPDPPSPAPVLHDDVARAILALRGVSFS